MRSAVWALLAAGVAAELDNFTSPTAIFHSRPDLHAPIIRMDIHKPQNITPGYIFLAPYRNIDEGAYIYDNDGNLVWSLAGQMGPRVAHAPAVCQYKGSDHLCYFEGRQHQGFAHGHGIIMDNNYRIVKTVETKGSLTVADMHEFKLIENGRRALMTMYKPTQYDLSPYGINTGMGWVVDSIFQEVDVESGDLIFEWRSLDHFSPSLSYVMAGTTDTSGDGLGRDSPWDFFHLNSIDKNVDGDYLLSARHMSGIYKISGVDGHPIWQLHGAQPTFHNTNFRFHAQHHARWLSENASHSVISIFDNASNAFNNTETWSKAMIVEINHIDKTATMIKKWEAPDSDGGVLSGSQGSLQMLPNGNAFVGWGDHSFFSEHTPNGTAVMYGKLAFWGSWVMMYRCYKFNWTATPLDTPTLYTYSRTGSNEDGIVFYVSWNGATEVRSWNFYSAPAPDGPFTQVANIPKNGFETSVRFANMTMWSMAEAIDGHDRPIRRSAVVKTFVPSAGLVNSCDQYGCPPPSPPLEENRVLTGGKPRPEPQSGNSFAGYSISTYYQQPLRRLMDQVDGTGSGILFVIVGLCVITLGLLLTWLKRWSRDGKEPSAVLSGPLTKVARIIPVAEVSEAWRSGWRKILGDDGGGYMGVRGVETAEREW